MRYYVVTIQIAKDGTAAQSITMADGVDEAAHDDARQKWHAEMSYCRLAKVLAKETCFIVDENSTQYEFETWVNAEEE